MCVGGADKIINFFVFVSYNGTTYFLDDRFLPSCDDLHWISGLFLSAERWNDQQKIICMDAFMGHLNKEYPPTSWWDCMRALGELNYRFENCVVGHMFGGTVSIFEEIRGDTNIYSL